MTGEQYLKAAEALGLTREQAAEFLGVNERTIRRWIAGTSPVPKSVEMLLTLTLQKKFPARRTKNPPSIKPGG
jgi:transcriptional regulator with XRE-family HTH domain